MLKSDVSNNYQNKIDLNLEKNTHKEVLYQSTDSTEGCNFDDERPTGIL